MAVNFHLTPDEIDSMKWSDLLRMKSWLKWVYKNVNNKNG